MAEHRRARPKLQTTQIPALARPCPGNEMIQANWPRVRQRRASADRRVLQSLAGVN
jgi:hypothetical protein